MHKQAFLSVCLIIYQTIHFPLLVFFSHQNKKFLAPSWASNMDVWIHTNFLLIITSIQYSYLFASVFLSPSFWSSRKLSWQMVKWMNFGISMENSMLRKGIWQSSAILMSTNVPNQKHFVIWLNTNWILSE